MNTNFKAKRICLYKGNNRDIYDSISQACRDLEVSRPTLIRHIKKGIHKGCVIKIIGDKEYEMQYDKNKILKQVEILMKEYNKNNNEYENDYNRDLIKTRLKSNPIETHKKYKINDFNEEYDETDNETENEIENEIDNETNDETNDEIDDETDNEADDETDDTENGESNEMFENNKKRFVMYLIDYFKSDDTKQDLIDYIFDEYKSNYDGEEWGDFIENKENEYNLND